MKVLHIVPTYTPAYGYGGPIKSVHFLNKWLVKNGVEVTVYTTNLNKEGVIDVPVNTKVDVDGVSVYYFSVSRLLRFWSYSKELRSTLKETTRDFDLVHITSVFLAASTLGAYYAKKFNIPYIVSPRGSLMSDLVAKKSRLKKLLYLKLFEERNLEGAAAVHFTSIMEKDDYAKTALPKVKSFIIPNSFDEEDFLKYEDIVQGEFRKKFKLPAEAKLVLYLGRISWKKGLDLLIRAMKQVVRKEPKAVLVVAGNDDGFESEARQIVRAEGLESVVRFCGFLLGRERVAAYNDADVFVLPSLSENFGQVVLEALYESVPVVVTTGTAVVHEMKEQDYILIVSREEDEIANKILFVLRNKNIKESARVGSRSWVIGNYSPNHIAQRIIAEYRKILDNKKL